MEAVRVPAAVRAARSLRLRELEEEGPLGDHLITHRQPAGDLVFVADPRTERDPTTAESLAHRYEHEWQVLLVAQHRRHWNENSVMLGGALDLDADEQITPQHAIVVRREDTNLHRLGARIGERRDICLLYTSPS